MKLHALLTPALLLAGCTAAPPVVVAPVPEPPRPGPMMPWTPQPEGLRFFVEPGTAAPGATVALVLHNGTAHEVGYNLCSHNLEQLQSGTWRPIPLGGFCTRELRTALPGQQARYQTRLPTSLAAGTYRFRTGVETYLNRGRGGLDQFYSETFTVR